MATKATQSPHVLYQKEDDLNCGPCCLAIVYKKFRVQRQLPDILRDFHFEEKGQSTYPAQLARDLLLHDIKTRIIISNGRVLSPAWADLPKDTLIEKLKLWLTLQPKHEWHIFGLHLLYYLLDGGDVMMHSYNVDEVKQKVSGGSQLLLAVEDSWLWGHRFKDKKAEINDEGGTSHGHYVLVTGYEKGKFSVVDPYPTGLPGREGTYLLDAQQLVNASLVLAGTVIEILPVG